MEEIKNIEMILLNPEILGEYQIEIFIEKILESNPNIKIIIFSNNIENINFNFFYSKNIYKIYPNNEAGYNKYLENINISEKTISEDIKREIKNLKENINSNKKRKKFFKKEKVNKKKFIKIEDDDRKIITISGSEGVGKTVFSAIFSKYLNEINKKILILDFDLYNQSLITLYGRHKKEKELVNISKNLNIYKFSGLYKNNFENFDFQKLLNFFNVMKKEYEVIIIDTSSNLENHYVKTIFEISNKILFLVEPNLLEIKKGINLLEIISKDFKINENKINIIFNKVTKYKIDNCILKEIFYKYEILEDVKYNDKYNLFINKNTNYDLDKNEFKNIYEKIKIKT